MAAIFGGYVRPANRRENRRDRRLRQHRTGKRGVVVVIRERNGRTLPGVFNSEVEALAFIRRQVLRGTELYADEASAWNALHARGVPSQKTYAAWPVWRDSTRAEIRWTPPPGKKAMTKLWHRARDFERQTRTTANRQDGALGRNGLAVLHALIFDFQNYVSGRLDPGYEALARAAGISMRSVARGLVRLRESGVVGWLRRCREGRDECGRYRLEQETNAYAVLPVPQWRGYRAPPEPPPPDPGTWGDHPPLPELEAQAVEECKQGGDAQTIVAILDQDPSNRLAVALASLGRTMAVRRQGFTGLPAWQRNRP
jgi:hypothetical protein